MPDNDRAAFITMAESVGKIDPTCAECREYLYTGIREIVIEGNPVLARPRVSYWDLPFYPTHTALASCQSGRHPHCTCDSCF